MMRRGHRTRVIELCGLPGAGKSTLTEAVLLRAIGARPSWLASLRQRALVRSTVYRGFLPLSFMRFWPLFHAALFPQTRAAGVRAMVSVLGQLASGRADARKKDVRKAFASLNVVNAEHWLLRLEAVIRRSTALTDEGLLQRGASLWILAPERSRDAVWDRFVEMVAGGVECVHVMVSPDAAFQRAHERPSGVPGIWTRFLQYDPRRDAANAAVDKLFGASLAARLPYASIETRETVEHGISLLLDLVQGRRLIVLSRPRNDPLRPSTSLHCAGLARATPCVE